MRPFGSWRRALVVPACVLVLMAVRAEPAAAQVGSGRVTGLVLDQTTKEPLAGVQVFIEGTSLGQLTGPNGRFFIMNIPAGTYTVVASMIGYAVVRRENVLVAVDQARTVDFELPTQAVALQEVIVEAERVPLVEMNATGSRDVITAEELAAMPVNTVSEALALQHGFFEAPMNTDVVSFLDQERGVTPLHIRGGRMGENIVMVDGIPVNNFMLGDANLDMSTAMVEQTDYSRGGFEAKYGNALSGVVNIRTRNARNIFQGSMTYQTSQLGGMLGNKYDEFRDTHTWDGFVSGPVPGTDAKLRFVVTGRNAEGATGVYEFDEHVYTPIQQSYTNDVHGLYGSLYDLVPGWRAGGFTRSRDIMGKLEYHFSPVAKLTFQATDNVRQTKGYQYSYAQVSFDHYGQCVRLYPELEDICRRSYLQGRHPEKMRDFQNTAGENTWITRNSVNNTSRLYAANWDHTMPSRRLAYNLAWGRNERERDTCSFLAGVCLGPRIASTRTNGPFATSGTNRNWGRHPLYGTSRVFGGDRSISQFYRGDLEWQATDHHNLSTGFFVQQHEISFQEGRDVGLNAIQIEWTRYGGEPWDGALYIQDRIEYDFVTLRFGMRFDYGRASGKFFANPQNPTNGTTAFHVCENPQAFGLPADQFTFQDPETGRTVSGITACSLDGDLMEIAVLKGMEDDFIDAKPRRSFSPRFGISFPITESSSLFFNYGRFTQNPLLNNLYRLTAIGTPEEGTRDALDFVVNATRVPLVGNAHLLAEQTTSYEIGYVARLDDDRYGFNATLYTKDQFNLTGSRGGGRDAAGRIIFDPGSTYRSTTHEYRVILNLDYQTARGMEFTLRRRLENFFAFDVRYAFSRVRTNAAPPELEIQRQLEEGDAAVRREIRSNIDRPHVGSLVLRFQAGNRAPDVPFGNLLRNTTISMTGRAQSGIPYTPQIDLGGSQRLERNSATSPTRYSANMQARRNFRHGNLSYGAFVRVDNVFNIRECLQVFPSTGRCDGGQITRSRLYQGSISSVNTISQAWDRPDYWSQPRSINAGITVTF
jgi:outer membrane receptor protein involved in Fe transport